MAKFKTEGRLQIFSLNEIELNIIPEDYGIVDTEDIFHAIVGEFFYCELATDGKLLAAKSSRSLKNGIIHTTALYVAQKIQI